MKFSPRKIQQFSDSPSDIESIFGSSSSSSTDGSDSGSDFPEFGVETSRPEPVQQPAVARPPSIEALEAARKPSVQIDSQVKSYEPLSSAVSSETASTLTPTSMPTVRPNGKETSGGNVGAVVSTETTDTVGIGSQGTAVGRERVLTPSGSESASAANQKARPAIVARPPVDAANGFNALDLNSYGNWIWIPVALLALFGIALFRWVTGTSSSDDLARYKYRGPKIADPDAPDVRGRFKKRAPANEVDAAPDVAAPGGIASQPPAIADEDDFDFFDEGDAATSTVQPSAADLPLVGSETKGEPLPSGYGDSPVSNGGVEMDFPADVPTESMPAYPALAETVTSESMSLARDDMQDSDDDFDFLGDEEAMETAAEGARPASDGAAQRLQRLGTQSTDNTGTVAVNDATGGTENKFDLTEPEAQLHDEDTDLFDDDSDAGFSFDDDELNDETFAAAGAVASGADEPQIMSAGDDSNELAVASDLDDVEHLAGQDAFVSESAGSGDRVADAADSAPVVATAAKVGAVASVAAAGGSWLGRMFGRKKSKAAADHSVIEEDGGAKVAVDDEGTPVTSSTESEYPSADELLEPKAVALADDDLAETNFATADNNDQDVNFTTASVDDDDFGMLDDDSDTGYEFDSVAKEAIEADAAAASVVSELDGEALADDALPVGESLASGDSHSPAVPSGVDYELGDLDESDSFDALFDEQDDELNLERTASGDVIQKAHVAAEPTDEPVTDDSEKLTDSRSALSDDPLGDDAEFSWVGEDAAEVSVTGLSSEDFGLEADSNVDSVGDKDDGVPVVNNLDRSTEADPLAGNKTVAIDMDELDFDNAGRCEVGDASPNDSELDLQLEPLKVPLAHDELPLLEDQLLDNIVEACNDGEAKSQPPIPADSLSLAGAAGIGVIGSVAAASGLAKDGGSSSSGDEMCELKSRIAILESANQTMEIELVQARETLASKATEQAAADDSLAKLADVEAELVVAQRQATQLKSDLNKSEELKQDALNSAEEAQAEVEQAKAEAELAKSAAEAATADAERAKAAVNEVAADAQPNADVNSEKSVSSLGVSMLAAAGGGLGALAATSVTGSKETVSGNDADDPFRLPPEKVKVMLKKLKTERKKRLKTKEYLLAAQAKQNEVTESLAKVNAELESLKLQISGGTVGRNTNDHDLNLAKDEQLISLQAKLDAAEQEIKKK